ncbi:MAG: VOC family protein [Candidatus Methylacidiphilales bacterium]|nr:VOC family protein [Candidatus Methylacidiphilales bacterium]
MPRPLINELKPFLPSKDVAVSRQFYLDFGFDITWEAPDGKMVAFEAGTKRFLVQNAWLAQPAGDFIMHMLVPDVDAWYEHLCSQGLKEKYGTLLNPPQDRPWGLRDFFFTDPSGVLWRIAGQPQ